MRTPTSIRIEVTHLDGTVETAERDGLLGEYVICRQTINQIASEQNFSIDDPAVERRHCSLVWDGSSDWVIRDLGTSSGTNVGGKPVVEEIAVSSGTSSLHIALKLVGVEEGDEVIAPSLTFIAPINAISYNGAKPIFMDSDKYFNISSNKTVDFITNETYFKNGFTYNSRTKKRIKAILPVHVWGNAAYLDELIPLCRKRNIKT